MATTYSSEQEKVALDILSKDKHAFYEILKVEKTASDGEIKKAYRKLAIKLHPDKNPHPKASEAFKIINRAFEVLSDSNKRSIYDRIGRDPDDRSMPSYNDSSNGAGSSSGFNGGVPPEFFRNRHQASPFGNPGGPEDIFDFLFNMNNGGSPFGPGGPFMNGGGATTFTFGPGGFRAYTNGHPRTAFQRRQRQQQARRAHDDETRYQEILRVLLPLLFFFLLPVLERLFFG